MAIDDEAPARPLPRFVPTLTEVVVSTPAPAPAPAAEDLSPAMPPAPHLPPAALPVAPAPAPVAAASARRAEPPDLVEALLARLGPDLERQIAEAVGRVLHEQMLGFNGRVRKAVADVVQDAVTSALLHDGARADVGENPVNRPSGT